MTSRTPSKTQQPKQPKLGDLARRTDTSLQPIISLIQAGEDSTLALLASAHIDHALESALTDMFAVDTRDKDNLLFGGSAPLSSTVSKVHLCYALGIIGDVYRSDLLEISAIRNAFAHARSLIKFAEEPINTKSLSLKALTHTRAVQTRYRDLWNMGASKNPRTHFAHTCIVIESELAIGQYELPDGSIDIAPFVSRPPRLP